MTVTCTKCECTFNSPSALKKHLKRKKKCDAGKHKCRKCSKKFTESCNIYRHQVHCQGSSSAAGPARTTQQLTMISEVPVPDRDPSYTTSPTPPRRGVNDSSIQDSHPVRLFADGVVTSVAFHESSSHDLQSKTNVIDLRAPQVYLRQVFGKWSNVHPVGRPQDVLSVEQLASLTIVKIGSQGESTGRQIMHTSAFARSTLVDSILTSSYSHLEMKVKDIWINSGQLYEGLHQGKSVRDTELLVVKDQTDYEQKLSVIQQLCDVLRKKADRWRQMPDKWRQLSEKLKQKRKPENLRRMLAWL